MKKTGRKNAFTLAEVLIALTIIGVIAAITVPALIQRTNKQEYVSALQKAYSTLSQAANMIIAEEGSPKGDDSWIKSGSNYSHDEVYDLFKKHLNNAKECRAASGCFPQGNIKTLQGTYIPADNKSAGMWFRSDRRRLILADGIQVIFDSFNRNCNISHGGNETFCGAIFVDVNGAKKPNQYGRDVFTFVLRENGLFPYGCYETGSKACIDSDGKPLNGAACACNVLREGAMNY